MNGKEEFVHFRVYPKEKAALEVLSTLESRNKSEMMRELIREGLQNRGLDFTSIVGKEGAPERVTA